LIGHKFQLRRVIDDPENTAIEVLNCKALILKFLLISLFCSFPDLGRS